jgi:phosphatidylserine decarboxylase
VAVLAAAALGGYALGGPLAALAPALLALAAAVLFREPARRVPSLPLAVVSPCAGRVASVRTVPDPWLERDSERVGMVPPGPGFGVLCSPTEGKVMD